MSITKTVPLWVAPDPRQLRVDYLRYPRTFKPVHFHWDLDRGFRLEVLGPGLFWLSLLAPECNRPVDCQPQGEQDFLLSIQVNCRGQWPDWPRERLAPSTVCAILSLDGASPSAPVDWPNLTIWVRQPMVLGTRWTGQDFFTPEQTMYQWGRVGRRVQRRARWRAWLPW